MNCPNCNTENKETAKFCMNCGTKLFEEQLLTTPPPLPGSDNGFSAPPPIEEIQESVAISQAETPTEKKKKKKKKKKKNQVLEQPVYQPPVKEKSTFNPALLILAAVAVIAFVTNPNDLYKHQDAVLNYYKNHVANESNNFLVTDFTNGLVESLVTPQISYEDYYLFSLTKVKDEIIGIGAFGKIFIYKELDSNIDKSQTNYEPVEADALEEEASWEAADAILTAHINGSNVNMRSGPSTNYSIITQFQTSEQVEVLDSYNDDNEPGVRWVKVRKLDDNNIGYVRSDFVTIDY